MTLSVDVLHKHRRPGCRRKGRLHACHIFLHTGSWSPIWIGCLGGNRSFPLGQWRRSRPVGWPFLARPLASSRTLIRTTTFGGCIVLAFVRPADAIVAERSSWIATDITGTTTGMARSMLEAMIMRRNRPLAARYHNTRTFLPRFLQCACSVSTRSGCRGWWCNGRWRSPSTGSASAEYVVSCVASSAKCRSGEKSL